jgi:glycosyltransferase involved in cell wall biosynthesis
VNYQSWRGFPNPNFGYGSMLKGFVDHVPTGCSLDSRSSVDVYMGVPFGVKDWLKGQHRVCFTMWETTELPGSFIRWLGQYDQILVPCQHNAELFSSYHDDVSVVPLGVDKDFWCPQPDPTGVFRFHAGGSLWLRKGLDVVVEVFNSLRLPDAELHIKAAPHASDVPKIKAPNVFLHREWMSLEETRRWFGEAHTFVAVSRGEGFGLMPLQAISMGIPTILSDSSGQKEFAGLASGVVSCGKSRAVTTGFWDEPNRQELADQMLDHYRNWDTKRKTALKVAKTVDKFSWGNASQKLVDAVPTGSLLKTKVRVAPDVWIDVRLNRNLTCDIGTDHLVFKKGEVYSVTEGQHQVLYDAGVLEKP